MGRSSAARGAIAVIGTVILVGVAWDLWAPRVSDIRHFDPAEVARIEAEMWRSYYEHERVRLFTQLGELLRTQYGLPPLRSVLAAFHAARAAFVFKNGDGRLEYEQALPDLERFYRALRRVSGVRFDPERAAKLELEWWIIHRERAELAPEELVHALDALQAEIYRVPADELGEHARLRAEAMMIRDRRAAESGMTEEDWRGIAELLHASWRSLSLVVSRSQG